MIDRMNASLTVSLSLTLLFAAAAIGCGNSTNTPPGNAAGPGQSPLHVTTSGNAAPEESGAGAAQDVTVKIKDFDGIQELIASKRGKVVVMDCWSTWCDPCVKEFPGLVELHKKYGADDLACVSLSFNYEGGKKETPEEHEEAVLDFLRSQQATFDNIIASVPSEKLYRQLRFKSATVPAIFVYDREGNIARQFESDEAKYSDVSKLVAELIEQGQ